MTSGSSLQSAAFMAHCLENQLDIVEMRSVTFGSNAMKVLVRWLSANKKDFQKKSQAATFAMRLNFEKQQGKQQKDTDQTFIISVLPSLQSFPAFGKHNSKLLYILKSEMLVLEEALENIEDIPDVNSTLGLFLLCAKTFFISQILLVHLALAHRVQRRVTVKRPISMIAGVFLRRFSSKLVAVLSTPQPLVSSRPVLADVVDSNIFRALLARILCTPPSVVNKSEWSLSKAIQLPIFLLRELEAGWDCIAAGLGKQAKFLGHWDAKIGDLQRGKTAKPLPQSVS
jgi:HrpA-like RNA helicase